MMNRELIVALFHKSVRSLVESFSCQDPSSVDLWCSVVGRSSQLCFSFLKQKKSFPMFHLLSLNSQSPFERLVQMLPSVLKS